MIVRQPEMGGELADAAKRLVGNVGAKVSGDLARVEFGLKVAAYASVAAAVLSLLSAVGSWKRR